MASPNVPISGDLFSVKGLVAVVTGAGGGLGLLMARALEANDAKVFILDISLEKLRQAQEESCDITSKESLLKAATEVQKSVGYINLLVANAGIPGPYPPRIAPDASLSDIVDAWWQTPIDSFLSTFRVNNAGTFYTILAFLRLLEAGNKEQNVPISSHVIATASITAFNRQVPSGFSYATSKAAVVHMMKQLSTYLIPFNIRCNTIAPGLYPTDMSGPALKMDQEKLIATIPAGRTGNIEDIAGAILFLASRAGLYCNGMVVLSDGGRLSTMPATY